MYSNQFQFDPTVLSLPSIREGKRGEELKTVKPYDLDERRKMDAELTKRFSFVCQGIRAIILLDESFCSLLNKIIFVPNSRGGTPYRDTLV